MENRETLLARYMVGRYRLGYENLAFYLAGALFEKIIDNKLLTQETLSAYELNRISLEDKIDRLRDEVLRNDTLYSDQWRDVFCWYMDTDRRPALRKPLSQNTDAVRKRLHNFRYLRNSIMHGSLERMRDDEDNKKENLLSYVWCELAPKSFEMAYPHRHERGGIISSMQEHTADYLVRDIDEIDIKPKDKKVAFAKDEPLKILSEDFENLYKLRRKLVPFKNFLENWVNQFGLFTDILTTIDTTSGYIWLPLTRKDPATKTGILTCSVSMLATPLDFRIYMDFGGRAKEERKLYYRFIGSDEYLQFVDQNTQSDLKVFDVDWYSHKFNIRNIDKSWIDNRLASIESATSKIDMLPEKSDDPLTWNRMLHGYIFQKNELGDIETITFKKIEPKLRSIIDFYKTFKKFAHKEGVTI